MKKLCLFSLIIAFVLVSSTVYSAEKAPLGIGNFALKMNYIEFTDDELRDLDVYKGPYVGLEGYAEIIRNLYLGAEIGYARSVAKGREVTIFGWEGWEIDAEVIFAPIEINLKYAFELAPNFVIDLGAGASYNFADIEISTNGSISEEHDRLFGEQFFVDLNFKGDKYFLGINGKYQITEDFEIEDVDTDVNFNNWRIGSQIGIMF